jgi:hypothetical protein
MALITFGDNATDLLHFKVNAKSFTLIRIVTRHCAPVPIQNYNTTVSRRERHTRGAHNCLIRCSRKGRLVSPSVSHLQRILAESAEERA